MLMMGETPRNDRWTLWSALIGISEAIRFLTIVPQPWLPPTHERSAAVAIPWFPVAGLFIGALLLPVGWLASLLWGPLVMAALVVATWGIITGGLHLDGLSDTFDALMSWRTPEQKLAIMKDSRIGAMGALALVAVLLLKLTLIAGAGAGWWQAVLLAPALGRWADCYGIWFFPTAKTGGLGYTFRNQTRRRDVSVATGATVLMAALIGGMRGLAALLIAWGVTHVLARWWTREFGGLTGDTYGALCEMIEVVALATLTAMPVGIGAR